MFFKLQIVLNLLSIRRLKKRYRNRKNELQTKRWKKFQKTLLKSPFYSPLASKSVSLSEYPLMNKATFMSNFDQINTHGINLDQAFEIALKAEQTRDFSPMIGEVTVGLSSGTSGNRGIFLATPAERAQWVAAVLDRVIGFSLRKRKVAFFLRANSNLYDSVKSNVLHFQFFDLFTDMEKNIAELNLLQPDILVAQPSMLLELAEKIRSGHLNIHPEKVISVAEVLYPEDKKILQEIFGQTIHQVYQCTEGFLASTCEHGTMHFNEDFLIIEKKYLDESLTRFHPVITDLMRSSQPIVRYELNDIIHEKKDCSCGSSFMAIEMIEGRSDDLLSFINDQGNEVKIFPDFFRRAIIFSDPGISDYAVVRRYNQKIELFIDGNDIVFNKAKQAVIDLLKKYNISRIEIERLNKNPHEKGNKLRRVRNEAI